MSSPTSRTKEWLEVLGYEVAIVERWISWGKPGAGGRKGNRVDAFGWGDVLAIAPLTPILMVQACSGAAAKRVAKIRDHESHEHWLAAGGRIQVWGWRKVVREIRGRRKVWRPRVLEVRAGDEVDITKQVESEWERRRAA